MSISSVAGVPASLRDSILADPSLILEDAQIMQTLLAAQEAARGGNIVDMRGLAMSKLEDRLGHLEDTHQHVISAAYDNVSVTRQVHRALLMMIEPLDFNSFLTELDTSVADCLRLRAVRLVMEHDPEGEDPSLNQISGVLRVMPAGFIAGYAGHGDRAHPQPVVLRGLEKGNVSVYGTAANEIRSEALVRLDLGQGRASGLLVLGASKPDHFGPGQATDLLELFSRVCERMIRGWLG